MCPHRLYHRLEDRNGNAATRRAAPERVTLAAGIIIAEPHSNGDVVGKAHKPGIVLIIGGAGLAGNKRGKVSDGACGATRQDPLHHALELIEGGTVDRPDRGDRFRIVAIYDKTVSFYGVNDVRRRARTFIRDGRIERREINRPYWLGAEDERIIVTQSR